MTDSIMSLSPWPPSDAVASRTIRRPRGQTNKLERSRDKQTAGTPLAERRPSAGEDAAAQQRVWLTGCLQDEGGNPTSPNVRPELPANRAVDANGSGFRLRRSKAEPGNGGHQHVDAYRHNRERGPSARAACWLS